MKRLRGIFCIFACGLLFPVAPALSKNGIEWADDVWIVILEDPPMARFEGEASALAESAGGGRVPLRPTAPSATGAARLDVTMPAARAYSAHLDARRESVLVEAGRRLGRAIEPVHVFEILNNGFSARMHGSEAQELAVLPGVKEVRQVEIHRPVLDTGPGLIGADRLWSGAVAGSSYRGEEQVIGIIDTGINWDSPYFSDQVPGYSFDNPYDSQLGECSNPQVTCNNKLVGVYDYTDEGTLGRDVDGHGSHVASIAAGNPVDFDGVPTSGVAPRAHIVSYKVCEEEDGDAACRGDAILAALDQAVTDGVDVVNYSIGGGPGNPWTADIPQAFLNLRGSGITGVAAAGNEGPAPGSITAPANAPWVIGAGNSTHGRLFGNRVDAAGISGLVGVLGTGPEPAADVSAPLADAVEIAPGNALGCDPFPAGSLSGAVVLIQRGDCFFRVKVDHASGAGAVAVLVFNNEGGAPIAMDMQGGTDIPAAMIGREDGKAVRAAIAQAAAPTATIHAETTALVSERLVDLMARGSSRGPAPGADGVMKPNLAAPGSNILGAGANGDNFAILSGTSMASPMVAGAAALLMQANPSWTPAMVHSALETTAEKDALRNHDGRAAGFNARGAGRLRIDRAARAGLYLNVTPSEFSAAQADPATLNLSGLVASGCAAGCDFTRRLTASRAGSWTVQTAGEVDLDVSPAQFTLSPGQSVTLQITATVPAHTTGGGADGAVNLVPGNAQLPTQKLTVGIDTSEVLKIAAGGNRGRLRAHFAGIDPSPEMAIASTPLVKSRTESRSVPQDPDPDDPYDGSAGTFVLWLDVPENAALLYAETLPSSAGDVDLFVGRDDDDINMPAESSERCKGTSPDDLERCVISQPAAGRWWVLVQNWQGSPGGGTDTIRVRTAMVPGDEDYSLSATGPGVHEEGLLPVRVAWDQPGMARAEIWIGGVSVGDGREASEPPRLLPLTIRRDVEQPPRHTAIIPGTGAKPVVVPAGGTHDRLFIDVPESRSHLTVSVEGDGVAASLAYLDFSGIEGSEPFTPPAPDNRVAGPIEVSGSQTVELSISGDEVVPGRYYVVLENAGPGESIVDVGTGGSIIGTPPPGNLNPAPRAGLWSPRNRSTGQGISWGRAGQGFITWYTYEEDGSPAFYLAAGPIIAQSPVWTGNMHRFTATDDVRRHAELVGRATLTVLAEDDLMFSWEIFGEHGSERMKPLASAECRNAQSLTGLWRVPAMAFGGTTVVMNPDSRAYVRYFFDDLGLPRWLITGAELGDDTLEALEWSGYCPYCEPSERSFEEAGTYRIDFFSETRARERIDAVLGPPVNYDFQFDREVDKLSESMECQ